MRATITTYIYTKTSTFRLLESAPYSNDTRPKSVIDTLIQRVGGRHLRTHHLIGPIALV